MIKVLKKKYGFVYIWRDRKHNRYYIGAHWGSEDDGYICSSTWMRNSYNKRPQDFKRRILKTYIFNKDKTFIEEYKWLCLINQEELGKKYYNRVITNFNSKGHDLKHSDISKEKMRQAALGKKASEETKEKMRQAKLGKIHTEETKEKMKIRRQNISEETKEKIRQAKLGKIHTEESNEKMRQAKLGKKASEETKEKLKFAALNRSEETKKKIRQANLGKKASEETKEKMKQSRKLYLENKEKLCLTVI